MMWEEEKKRESKRDLLQQGKNNEFSKALVICNIGLESTMHTINTLDETQYRFKSGNFPQREEN